MSVALYRLLLRLFPRSFRARYGDDMVALFQERIEKHHGVASCPRRRSFASARITASAYADLVRQGLAERFRPSLGPQRRGPEPKPRGHVAAGLALDLTHFCRLLTRAPGFALVAVLTLALGLGLNVALFSVIHAVLLAPLPYPEPDRMVRVWDRNDEAGLPRFSVSPGNYVTFRDESRSFAALGAYREDGFNLGLEEPRRVRGARVTASLFAVLGVAPQLGRALSADEDRPGGTDAVVLGHELWRTSFHADEAVLGSSIRIDGEPHTVVAVLPRGFVFPQQEDVQLLLPYRIDAMAEERGAHFLRVLGRLRPQVELEQARADLATIAGRLEERFPDSNAGWTTTVLPLARAVAGELETPFAILAAAACLVLLVACANLANLLLARASQRRRELAVRAALGADRSRILRQLLTESVLLALLGGGVGLLVARGTLLALPRILPEALPRQGSIAIDGPVFGFALLLTLATGLLFGLVPGLRSSAAAAREAPQRGYGGSGERSGERLRALLVTSEVAVTLALMIAAALLLRSFAGLLAVAPGFESAGVVSFEITATATGRDDGPERVRFYEQLLARLVELPGVEGVAAVHRLPLLGNSGMRLHTPDDDPDETVPSVNFRSISPGYHTVLQIPLLEGRAFRVHETFEPTTRSVLVNRALAEQVWPGETALGKRLSPSPQAGWLEVVGVVQDSLETSLAGPPEPAVYLPYALAPVPTMQILLRSDAQPQALAPQIRAALRDIDPALATERITPLEDVLAEVVAQPRFQTVLVASYAALALLLACVGVHGVVAHATSQRTREIGLRIAVGARARDVLVWTLRHGLTPIALGVGLGLVLSLFATRSLESLLYGTTPLDAPTFLAAATVLLVVAAAACLLPAWRAARVDPIVALRHD